MTETGRFTLANGLRVVHRRNSDTAMVALTVTYATGSRHEDPSLTGVAHLFEHVMFGGSLNVPDYNGAISAAGGEDNAYTSSDFTTYYSVVPAHNAETAFRAESDRMLRPLLSPQVVDVQRSVGTEEFRQQCLNSPYGDTMHHLLPMIYPDGHPYSWPTIGKDISHIARITRDDLEQWFLRNYSVHNAVLGITGNITAERARDLAEKWFGDIAPRPVAGHTLPRQVTKPLCTLKKVSGNVPVTRITVAYPMAPYGHPDTVAADALTDLLSDGNASLLPNRLVRVPDAVFTQTDAMITARELQGNLLLTAQLSDERHDPEAAARLLTDTAATIALNDLTDRQLQRIKNRRAAICALNDMDYIGTAQRLCLAEIHGEQPDDALDAYMALTADRINDVARRILLETTPAVMIYHPANS